MNIEQLRSHYVGKIIEDQITGYKYEVLCVYSILAMGGIGYLPALFFKIEGSWRGRKSWAFVGDNTLISE